MIVATSSRTKAGAISIWTAKTRKRPPVATEAASSCAESGDGHSSGLSIKKVLLACAVCVVLLFLDTLISLAEPLRQSVWVSLLQSFYSDSDSNFSMQSMLVRLWLWVTFNFTAVVSKIPLPM